MKNIHLLPTEKPSRLWINNLLQGKLELSKEVLKGSNTAQHIYITSDEEIKVGDWYFITESISKCESKYEANDLTDICKKIILTTDQDLIADGVQAIDDEFLEWFVKNPSCEFVETKISRYKHYYKTGEIMTSLSPTPDFSSRNMQCEKVQPIYKIIIPQEEPKFSEDEFEMQSRIINKVWDEEESETLEEEFSKKLKSKQLEFSSNLNPLDMFNLGAEWQSERMYSEDDLRKAFKHGILFKEESVSTCEEAIETEFSMLVEQFKKK
jgi:hypothetical protein